MEQSEQHKKRQRFAQKMKQVGWMGSILAAFCAALYVTEPTKPFSKATIDNFAVVKDTIADARIIEKTNVSYTYPMFPHRNKFYELDINTSSGQMFHLKRPDFPGQLTHYLAVLPIGKEVSIRYFNRLFDGYVILDVRDDNHIFIPFSEIIADENRNQKFVLIWAGIFALLGVIGFWFGRKKQKRHSISEHTKAHRK